MDGASRRRTVIAGIGLALVAASCTPLVDTPEAPGPSEPDPSQGWIDAGCATDPVPPSPGVDVVEGAITLDGESEPWLSLVDIGGSGSSSVTLDDPEETAPWNGVSTPFGNLPLEAAAPNGAASAARWVTGGVTYTLGFQVHDTGTPGGAGDSAWVWVKEGDVPDAEPVYSRQVVVGVDGATGDVDLGAAAANAAPSARYSFEPAEGQAPLAVEFDARGSWDPDGNHDSLRFDWTFGDGVVAEDAGPTVTHTYDVAASYEPTLTVTDVNDATDTCQTSTPITVEAEPLGPPADPGVPTNLADSTSFLYEGDDPIQTGVEPGTIDKERVGVLRGVVRDDDLTPLEGVRVRVLDRPELGETRTRASGEWDLAVNAGDPLTVQFDKDGYLPSQRQLESEWGEFEVGDDVVLVPLDSESTQVTLDDGSLQVVEPSEITDDDGTRQNLVFIPPGTTAYKEYADGSTEDLDGDITVRVTEYTVGDDGPERMPAELPPTTAYTYAAEFSVDEAADAQHVHFSQPVFSFVDNFLEFPTGMIVPVGSYEENDGAWVAQPNGRVIEVLDEQDDQAVLDVTGSGQPATTAELDELGITADELTELADRYDPDDTVWRMPHDHFSRHGLRPGLRPTAESVDGNPGSGPPPGAGGPGGGTGPGGGSGPGGGGPCEDNHSVLEPESCVLREGPVPIAETSFDLWYANHRTPGGSPRANEIDVQLTTDDVHPELEQVVLEYDIAGQYGELTFPPNSNMSYTLTWDGRNGHGIDAHGRQPYDLRIGYVYDAVYLDAVERVETFGLVSGVRLTQPTRDEYTFWADFEGTVGRYDAEEQHGLGGWTIDQLHQYDPAGGILERGDGTRRSVEDLGERIATTVDDSSAPLGRPWEMEVGPDGAIYWADFNSSQIKARDPETGAVTTVAGGGTDRGDGPMPATSMRLDNPQGLALYQDQLYIGDVLNHKVRVLDLSTDTIRTFAGAGGAVGGGAGDFAGDGLPATHPSVRLNEPSSVAVSDDGTVYLADRWNNRVRVVRTNGYIDTFAGGYQPGPGDPPPWDTDDRTANQAGLFFPNGLAWDGTNESLLITDFGHRRVREVTKDGDIECIAGACAQEPGGGGIPEEGQLAVDAELDDLRGLDVASDGTIYLADFGANRVYELDRTDGTIHTYAGGGTGLEDGIAPTAAHTEDPSDVAVAPDGDVLIADRDPSHQRILEVAPTFPGYTGDTILIPAADGSVVYEFDPAGKHLATRDAFTGDSVLTFTYDAPNGRLSEVTDRYGEEVTVAYDDGAGTVTFTAPSGQETTLQLDAAGWLQSATNDAGEAHTMTYADGDGLLETFARPEGHPTTFSYDELGRVRRDEAADGRFVELDPTDTEDGRETVLRTALGRETTYLVETLADETVARRVDRPSGASTSTVETADGTVTHIDENGTHVVRTPAPDPRFGRQLDLTGTETTTTPGGKRKVVETSRAVDWPDPANPFSIRSETDTITVNGTTFTVVHDVEGRELTMTTPEHRVYRSVLDAHGRVAERHWPGELPVVYTYTARGSIESLTQGPRVFTFTYDPGTGRLTRIDGPAGWSFVVDVRDTAGRIEDLTLAGGLPVAYGHDRNGSITSVTPPGQPAHGYTDTVADDPDTWTKPSGATWDNGWNLDGQLDDRRKPDGTTIDIHYYGDDPGDQNTGQLKSVTHPDGGGRTYTYAADTGQVETVTSDEGVTVRYGRDGHLLTSETAEGVYGQDVTLGATYDDEFQLRSTSVNGGHVVSYDHDDDGFLTRAGELVLDWRDGEETLATTTLDAVTTSHTPDEFGDRDVDTYVGPSGSLYSVDYERDDLGRITTKTEVVAGTAVVSEYAYDAAGRLHTATVDGATTSYCYDDNGNRTGTHDGTVDCTGVAAQASHDGDDRLLADGDVDFGYTANGELEERRDTKGTATTTDDDVTTYTYDGMGRLTDASVQVDGDTTTVGYDYDGRGRRIRTTVDGTPTQAFVYGNQISPVAEIEPVTGEVRARYVYGGRGHVPDYVEQDGERYRLVTDQLGSVRAVVRSSDGAVVQEIDYDVWGREVRRDSVGSFDQPFGFAGGIADGVTGLVHFGARDLDPSTGRWTTPDPIGQLGGLNTYVYADNDPVNHIDPTGLESESCEEAPPYDGPEDEPDINCGGSADAPRCHVTCKTCHPRCKAAAIEKCDGTINCSIRIEGCKQREEREKEREKEKDESEGEQGTGTTTNDGPLTDEDLAKMTLEELLDVRIAE